MHFSSPGVSIGQKLLLTDFLSRTEGPNQYSISSYLLLLTDTMGSGEGLDIVVGIPIGVIDNDGIGSGQVDTQTTSAGGQQEHELLSAGGVESGEVWNN